MDPVLHPGSSNPVKLIGKFYIFFLSQLQVKNVLCKKSNIFSTFSFKYKRKKRKHFIRYVRSGAGAGSICWGYGSEDAWECWMDGDIKEEVQKDRKCKHAGWMKMEITCSDL